MLKGFIHQIGMSAFCVAFSSSAYAAAIPGVMREFGPNLDVALLGLSLFVLGFGLGPLVWGPLSEVRIGEHGLRVIANYNAYINSFTVVEPFSSHRSFHTRFFTLVQDSPRTPQRCYLCDSSEAALVHRFLVFRLGV
jgi:MFS family permease